MRRSPPVDGWFHDDAWQVVAAGGPLRLLPWTGQTQPAFTAVLAGLERLFGTGSVMALPAWVAGVTGPAVLYLVLRRLRFGRGVAAVASAPLLVAGTHVRFSGRVKVYTAEVVVVAALAMLVAHLADRRWGRRTAVAWVVVALALAVTSSFSLLAASAAGAALALHPRGDRRVRWAAVGVQAAGTLATLAWTQRTYDSATVAKLWDSWDGIVGRHDPVGIPVRLVAHAWRVVDVVAPGPAAVTSLVLVVAAAGLLVASWRGPRRVVARYLLLAVGLAALGSIAGKVPFGPSGVDELRVSLWLAPVVAFGVASALDVAGGALRPVAACSGARSRRAAELALGGLAILVVVAGMDTRAAYSNAGAEDASRFAAAAMRPGDVVWVTRLTVNSFALSSGLDYRVEVATDQIVGVRPVFEDDRIVVLGRELHADELGRSTAGAQRVMVVNAALGGDNTEVVLTLASVLSAEGFEVTEAHRFHRTTVTVLERPGRHPRN